MLRQSYLHASLALLACVALSGCGTTGRTSTFTLALDLPKPAKATSEIHVASAAMDVDAAHLNAVNVQPWGKFDVEDLRNIERSLQRTISHQVKGTLPPAGPRVDIHVVIRRYVVSTSNTAGAVLACVAWAATTPKGVVLYDEQFYASDTVYLIGTIGRLKDAVHKAIVRRIATTALLYGSDSAGMGKMPMFFDKTSSLLEVAAAPLPREMVSLGNPSMMAFPNPIVSTVGVTTTSAKSTIAWTVAKPSKKFDWGGYLAKTYGP